MYFCLLDSYCPFLENFLYSALYKKKSPQIQNPIQKCVKQSKTMKHLCTTAKRHSLYGEEK